MLVECLECLAVCSIHLATCAYHLEKVPVELILGAPQVGTYYYKHVIDDERWSYSPDAPITQPDRDGNVNNYVEVNFL